MGIIKIASIFHALLVVCCLRSSGKYFMAYSEPEPEQFKRYEKKIKYRMREKRLKIQEG